MHPNHQFESASCSDRRAGRNDQKTMKTTLHHLRTLATLCVALLLTHTATAQTYWIGTNGVSASTNWSDSANWSAGLPSGLAVVFTNSPAAATLGTINNVVDSDTTVA